MNNSIQPPRARGTSQEIRSQVALEILLNAFAVVGAAVLLRCLLLGLGVSERLWLGRFVYELTDVFIMPLSVLPGAGNEIYRSLTIADVTMSAGVILFPLGLYARGGRRQRAR
ncbi:MAG: hypothetical protein ACRDJH_09805 [Thermomicrobiales bacterium]